MEYIITRRRPPTHRQLQKMLGKPYVQGGVIHLLTFVYHDGSVNLALIFLGGLDGFHTLYLVRSLDTIYLLRMITL